MAPLEFLRNVVGPEPTDAALLELLAQHSGNVERAANTFFTTLGVEASSPLAPVSNLSSQDFGTRTYRFEAGPVGLALANSRQLGGIVVSDVVAGSQAERVGVPILSVITHVDGQSLGICAAQDLVQTFRTRGERPMLLRVRHPPPQQHQPPPQQPLPDWLMRPRGLARADSVPPSPAPSPALSRERPASFAPGSGQRMGLLSPQPDGGGGSPAPERSRSFFMRRRSSSSSKAADKQPVGPA